MPNLAEQLLKRLSSWWSKIKQHQGDLVLGAIILAVVIALILGGYRISWTGFNGYDKVTKEFDQSGVLVKTTTESQGKTLWDWLQLLFVPAAISLIGILFARMQQKTEIEAREDNQREAELKTYIDRTTDVFLNKNLRNSKTESDLWKITRIWTAQALHRMNAYRKRRVLLFLYFSGLLNANDNAVILKDADVREVDLRYYPLSGINLSGAGLWNAYLNGTLLNGANLSGTDLRGADLRSADLS
jgi:hypothetical protein